MASERVRQGSAGRRSRLCGLANFYLRTENLDGAERVLEQLADLGDDDFRSHLVRARLFILRGRDADAVSELERCRELDPFDEETCDLLGMLEHARGRFEAALDAWADAKLLAAGIDPEQDATYAERLREVLGKLDRPAEAETEVLSAHAERLEELAEAARDGDEAGPTPEASEPASAAGTPHASEEASATDVLRQVGLFDAIDDADLALLDGATARLHCVQGTTIFQEGQASEDIYVVEGGRVRIQRETPFGTQVLATVDTGSVFGEMNFIDGLSRSADAIAVDDTWLVRISHAGLQDVFDAEPGLALAFLKEFWRGLADKVRYANDLMKSFFDEAAAQEPKVAGAAQQAATASGREAGIDAKAKEGVLHEQGLTGDDLSRLADFAEARTFDVEAPIFLEGEPGDALYVVLDGKVRISKQIPGVGEEALAILERGAFFGEMALLDGAPRSATAKAHDPDTTVLRIAKSDLDALLGRRASSALGLLSILCRILSARLREINDKIIQWRMMSGGF